ATRLGAGGGVSRRRDTGLATQKPAQDIAESSTRKAGLRGAAGGEGRATRAGRSGRSAGSALEGLVSEETKERRHDWRHPASLTTTRIAAGLALAARTILHAIEDIKKSHNLSPESK